MEDLLVSICGQTDTEVVAAAVAAKVEADSMEETWSDHRWQQADCYAELSRRGWGVRKIAQECGTNKTTAAVMIRCVSHYWDTSNRPTFWEAFSKFHGKSTAQRIVSSDSNEWYTPARYIEAARAVLGEIDLDPASCETANQVVRAATFYAKDDDGLKQPWEGRLWLNPPYGREAGEFVRRLVLEYRDGDVEAAIALVNAHCTDTDWFQSLWDFPLCFTDHRIDFETDGRDKNAHSTHGSVFAYLGEDDDSFLNHFQAFGAIVRRV